MTETEVRDALRDVIDPELGINIVDLGLVYEVAIDGARVRIVMTMTSPACPLGDYLKALVDTRIKGQLGADDVEIAFVWTPPWQPDMMSEAARRQLGWDPGPRGPATTGEDS